MSLYTPVFPSFHESNTSRKGPPENTATSAPGSQQNYVDFLRDVHLFLSTQSDTLSPPSRPNSPLFDHRVKKVRDQVQKAFNAAEGDTSSGKWARVSQALKLGCVRGRYWSVSGAAPRAPEEDTNWILPEEESEWIEWEKKREENRRLKGKTNVSLQIGTATTSAAPSSQKSNHASFTQPHNVARERRPRDVSPTTMRVAKEKVRKWQASVPSEALHDTTHGSSPASTRAVVAATAAKDKTERPQRSRTLNFAVVKPAAKSNIGKSGRGSLSRPGVRGGSFPIPSQKSKLSTPSKAANAAEVEAPVGVDETSSKQPPKTSPVKDDTPKIADMPETPYLPPSFPTHLETSTPLPDSAMVIRAKPSPILPITALSSPPLPSTSADVSDGRRPTMAEPHAANVSSCLPPQPPQIDTVQPGKRARSPFTSLDGIPNDPPVTPPAKRLRSLSQNRSVSSDKSSKAMSPNGGLGIVPRTGDDARDPNTGSAPSHPYMDTVGMASGAPSTSCKNDQPPTGADTQDIPEKIPSPTKSVKSYFSAPDSDLGDSPLKANLLLESPVSPMLSYAQNASGFLPQFTSTQVGKGSPSAGRTNGGFGIGYSSQFDVERHVDRVSELLEKDVDFDGWLRDVRTVEMYKD